MSRWLDPDHLVSARSLGAALGVGVRAFVGIGREGPAGVT